MLGLPCALRLQSEIKFAQRLKAAKEKPSHSREEVHLTVSQSASARGAAVMRHGGASSSSQRPVEGASAPALLPAPVTPARAARVSARALHDVGGAPFVLPPSPDERLHELNAHLILTRRARRLVVSMTPRAASRWGARRSFMRTSTRGCPKRRGGRLSTVRSAPPRRAAPLFPRRVISASRPAVRTGRRILLRNALLYSSRARA